MAEPFLGEIRLMSFNFAPKGWALSNGQLLPISQNTALFSLLGTAFGGDGRTNFALPNFQGRTPIHFGNGHTMGESGGAQTHTLTAAEMPAHTHPMQAASGNATTAIPGSGVVLAASVNHDAYRPASSPVTMHPASVSIVGGNQAHENMQPFLAISFCIALAGIFPSPS